MAKRVNITFNTDNPMDSLIISLLGGEDFLTSKGIKAKLLEMALNNNVTHEEQKRNVLVTQITHSSNEEVTQKERISNDDVTNITHERNNPVTKVEHISSESDEFNFDDLIEEVEVEAKKEDKDNNDIIKSLYSSMMKF